MTIKNEFRLLKAAVGAAVVSPVIIAVPGQIHSAIGYISMTYGVMMAGFGLIGGIIALCCLCDHYKSDWEDYRRAKQDKLEDNCKQCKRLQTSYKKVMEDNKELKEAIVTLSVEFPQKQLPAG